MDAAELAHLETEGFVVLRDLFDATALSAEFDRAMAEAFDGDDHVIAGAAGNQFRYVPMMSENTPASIALVVQLAWSVAVAALGPPVLPTRAKGTNYLGATQWHRDSELGIRSIGIACYLDALRGESGALRVLPGSHRAEPAVAGDVAAATELSGVAVPTRPGDAIVFDEHLWHASTGGTSRRQWRVDFVADGRADHAVSDQDLRAYYAGQYAPGWDGGYDLDRFPSYGPAWRTVDARWNARLTELGAYSAAADEEAFARARRSARRNAPPT